MITLYRRKLPTVYALRWTDPAPANVPMWLAGIMEFVHPDGTLLLKPSANRQRVAPGEWVVLEPGCPVRVLTHDQFNQAYEEAPDV